MYPKEDIDCAERKDPADFSRNWRTWARIYSTMLTRDREPDAENKRHRTELAIFVLTVRSALQQLDHGDGFQWTAGAGLDLIAGAAELPAFEKEETVRSKHGQIAGAVLLEFVGATIKGKNTNLNDCKGAVAENLRVSVSSINNDGWGNYRNTSHLWASLHSFSEEEPHFPPTYPLVFSPHRGDVSISKVLGLAETLRKYGEARWPGADPALTAGETWAVAPGVALPHFDLNWVERPVLPPR